MRSLWVLLLVAPLSTACNSSTSGNACGAAGGFCTIGSCPANGQACSDNTCWMVLPSSAQDCPAAANPAFDPGSPCCEVYLESGAPSSTDAGGTADATITEDAAVTTDATVLADSTVATDGSLDVAVEAETGTSICPLVNDGGDGGFGMCSLDGAGDDSGASDAPSDG